VAGREKHRRGQASGEGQRAGSLLAQYTRPGFDVASPGVDLQTGLGKRRNGVAAFCGRGRMTEATGGER
jgi:hypothetical protein